MKKILSVILAVLMAATAFFAVTASAEEENRSIKFIKDLAASKTLSIEADASNLSNGYIENAKIYYKYGDQVKIAGTAKVLGKNVKLFASGKDIDAYFSIFKIDVDKIAGVNIDLSSIAETVNPVFDKLGSEIDRLEYKPELSSDGEDVLGVKDADVKNYLIEKAKENGVELTAEDVEGKSVSELVELAGITDETQIKYLNNAEKAGLHFYYTDGKLTRIVSVTVNRETGELETDLDTSNIGGLKIISIGTNVDDSVFNKPKFAIDITGVIKLLMGIIMK